jgi:hypothetical protein
MNVIATLKVVMAKNLDKRLPLTDSVRLATLLDPSTKSLLSDSSRSENSTLLLNAMQQYCKNVSPSATATVAAVCENDGDSYTQEQSDDCASKRSRLLQKYRCASMPIDDSLRNEIETYLGMQAGPEVDENPLLFWKTSQLKNLKRLAKIILTRSASCSQSGIHVFYHGSNSEQKTILSYGRQSRFAIIHSR